MALVLPHFPDIPNKLAFFKSLFALVDVWRIDEWMVGGVAGRSVVVLLGWLT